MNYLLLKEVLNSDSHLVDKTIIDLAKLTRAGLTPDGMVVFPKLSDPTEVIKIVKKERDFYFQSQNFSDFNKFWGYLLKVWQKAIELKKEPTPQVVLFIKVDKAVEGSTPEVQEVVKKAQKLLVLPHQFTLSDNQIIKVTPIVEELEIKGEVFREKEVKDRISRTTVKLFAPISEISDVFSYYYLSDSPSMSDEDLIKITKLESHSPVIIFLPDIEVDGCFGVRVLLNRTDYLKQFSERFLFLRHKKMMLNIHLGIPAVKSVFELDSLKKELATLNIARKGSLKFWLMLSTPENFLNLESFLESGLDGVVMDLDQLNKNLIGFSENERSFYSHDFVTLLDFIKGGVKLLQKQKKPIIVKGLVAGHPVVVRFIVSFGIYAVMVERSNLSIDHLNWEEKRAIHTLL